MDLRRDTHGPDGDLYVDRLQRCDSALGSEKIKGTPFFSVAFNGLQMTITPIADEVIKNASTRTINLATVTAGATMVPDFSTPSVTLSFNVKKATPTFKFASAGKSAIIGDKTASPKISGLGPRPGLFSRISTTDCTDL